jgi:hypothetical protein
MKIIKNSIIPFEGFDAMTIWPFIFVRKDETLTPRVIRHEETHGEQQKEMLLIFFLLWYYIEWLIKWTYYKDKEKAYDNISFEREAYAHQYEPLYLYNRKHFAWIKYLSNSNI